MGEQLGELRDGDYVRGPDGRAYADLTTAEKLEVIERHVRAIHDASAATRKRLSEEMERVLALPTKEARLFHMEQFRLNNQQDFAQLAAMVRAEFVRRRIAAKAKAAT